MDKNTVTGLLLIGAILIGFTLYNSSNSEKQAKIRAQQDSIALVQKNIELQKQAALAPATTATSAPNDTMATAKQKELLGPFASAATGKDELLTLENDLIKVSISTKGGKINAVQLKKHKTFDGKPLYLFEGESNSLGLNFFSQNKNISTKDLYFQPITNLAKPADADQVLGMRLSAGEGKYLDYIYTIKKDSYDVGFTINTVGFNDVIPNNTNSINLFWKITAPRQEKNVQTERLGTTIYYKYDNEDVDYLTERKDAKETLKTKVKWLSFKEQYFTSVLIADNAFDKPTTVETVAGPKDSASIKTLSAEFSIPYSHKPVESFGMKFYFGPSHYETLKKYNLDLEKQIPLGWGIFGWVNRFIVIKVFNFLAGFNLNYGIIILILTILIKMVLWPFTYKAYMSQAKMKVLKPEIDEIQARKGDDPMKTQQELMALYKKAGVNPLGGCLPMLFQLPILIAMFRFFPSSIELRQQSFLWAKDLSTYDSILDFGFNIPFYGDHVSLFTILMTVSTLIYTRMNNQFTGANAQMKWMSYLMPIVFLGVFNNYSAGLSYYYFLANIFTFGQQYMMKQFVDEKALHAQIQENKKKPLVATKSKFQQRLEEMAKAKGAKPKK